MSLEQVFEELFKIVWLNVPGILLGKDFESSLCGGLHLELLPPKTHEVLFGYLLRLLIQLFGLNYEVKQSLLKYIGYLAHFIDHHI
jgi:hypothetical protein